MHQRDYTIQPRKGHFDYLYEILAEVANLIGMADRQRFRFTVAVFEAYTNAFIHGNNCDPTKNVCLSFKWDNHSAQIAIEDEGEQGVEAINLDSASAVVPAEKSDGRGIGIIKKYADGIRVEQREGGGLRLVLEWKVAHLSGRNRTISAIS